MKIAWTKKMSVYDEKIDGQHKRLLETLEELREELSSGVDMNTLRKTLDFLSKYITEHLDYEESYLIKHNYPDFDKHKAIHDKFRAYYKGFGDKFRKVYYAGNFSSKDIEVLVTDAENFLADWWLNHIQKDDHKYAVFIKSNFSEQ